jgi:predicted transcriptional regulator
MRMLTVKDSRRMHDGNLARGVYLSNSSASMTNTNIDTMMVGAVAQIVSAYVAKNDIAQAELPVLIQSVHRSLVALSTPITKPAEAKAPAVSVKKSLAPEFLVCLEDGKKFKSLKRHLRAVYSMTPEQYREKWSLPADYPMVAPNYAKRRSELAKNMGLGSQRKGRTQPKSQS